jgi:DNA-binding transcriptional regulator YhcF (GntR family)
MKVRHRLNALPDLFIDPYSQVPAHAQLKQLIKFACSYQEMRPGDVLPSIRALAERLGVGAGVVRRAYRELCEVGFLATTRRKHVVVAPGSIAASEGAVVARECTERCEQLIAWAREKRLSAIAIGRLLLERARELETDSPSYLFVDICHQAAQESADRIAKAWEIRVTGLSVDDFTSPVGDDPRRFSIILVNQYLYEDVMAASGEMSTSILPVRMRMEERLQRRIRRLPPNSRVLLVLPNDHFSQLGKSVLRRYRHLFGRKWRFHAQPVRAIRDLTDLVRSRRYHLFLLSPVVWEKTPTRLRKSSLVDRVVDEPDPRSLEETRIAAGVLL